MAEWYHRGGKKYRIRQFCRRDEQGKKIYCYDKTHVFENAKERDAFIRNIETKHANGTWHVAEPDKNQVALNEHLDTWLAHKKVLLERNTFADYEWNLQRYIRPILGDRPLASIKPLDIQKIYNEMVERGLSARSVANLHNVLSQALEKAVWWELIQSNPANHTERPPVKRRQIEVLQTEEAPKFLEQAMKNRLGPLFAFMLTNGARPEECYGLQWSELDLVKGKAEIWRVLKWNRKGGGWRFRDYPKTDAGRRSLDLDQRIIVILKEWRKRQLMEKLASKRYQDNNLVFCTLTGEPLYPTNVQRRHFKPIVVAAKLNPALRLYDLRHSFATLSIAGGVEAKKVSYDLGHASVAFTLDTYCHIVDMMRTDASGKLESILFPKVKRRARR
jgi:integrase